MSDPGALEFDALCVDAVERAHATAEQPGRECERQFVHQAGVDILKRFGALGDAAHSYRPALELVGNESERRFLQRRLNEVLAGGA